MSIKDELANYKYHYESAYNSMEHAKKQMEHCRQSENVGERQKVLYWMERVDRYRQEYNDWKRHYNELNTSIYVEK